MEVLKDKYTITELSGRLGITDHALRYYEKEFLLKIPKDERGRRFYTPEDANLMFKIKTMRDDGLEIKAIKKILNEDNYIPEPPPVVSNSTDIEIIEETKAVANAELKAFFDELKNQITDSISSEVVYARDQISSELQKTKLELGACVENGMRKIETKLDRHFLEVDKALGRWREKSLKNPIQRLFTRQ